ncbi:flavoprotein [uncultured Ilyobacter sp.]|jgi:phosphopantothenoylcysteine synthetase/decarboxylase|uniref:flavoprotein n=1 Tax=uncultured Ilyobacter sp. TaxID=544433 RepID=UPI0029C0FDA4|nr:flavoprotein [uncultured Ilyobacter sp.]
MEFDLLIDHIVKEVMGKLKTQNAVKEQEKKRCLVIVNGGTVSLEQVLLQLKEISCNYDLKILFSQAGREIVGEERFSGYETKELSMTEASSFLKNIDIVLLPLLTKNTCAKVAVGIRDNTVTYIISKAISAEKEIVAVNDSCSTEDGTAYADQLNLNIKKLKSYGITFVKSTELSNYILRENKKRVTCLREKKIITLADLFNIKNRKIVLSKDTIVTALAKEKAKDNEVSFEIEE